MCRFLARRALLLEQRLNQDVACLGVTGGRLCTPQAHPYLSVNQYPILSGAEPAGAANAFSAVDEVTLTAQHVGTVEWKEVTVAGEALILVSRVPKEQQTAEGAADLAVLSIVSLCFVRLPAVFAFNGSHWGLLSRVVR
jgi:hypothetical protein